MPYLLAGAALTAAGVSCLYGSWKNLLPGRFWPASMGWALLTSSVYAWSRASGAEFGTSFALLLPALAAWIFAFRNAELRQQRNRKRRPQAESVEPLAPANPRSWSRHLLLFLVTVPLAGTAATLVSIAVSRWLPWSDLNEMIFAIIAMPVLWGCASYWAVADSKLLRPTLTMIACGLLASALLFL